MNVLLVDDHPLILSALQSVIKGLGDHVRVTGVGSARETRETLQRDSNFDLVLLDLHLGDANGFDLLAELRSTYPALPVVVVSASDRASDVIRAIDLGAMGFVPKRASNEDLFEALRMVMSGGIYVPPMTLGSERRPTKSDENTAPDALPAETQTALDNSFPELPSFEALGITQRQNEVLTLLLQGKPNKMIARELSLSVETVKDHVANVLHILGVTSRTQAILAISQMSQQPSGLTSRKKSR